MDVRRHIPGEDTSRSEGTWTSEDTSRAQSPCQGTCRSEAKCVREDSGRRQVRQRHASSRRHVAGRRHVPKTGRARTPVVACGRLKTFSEDRSCEDTFRREDTYGRAKTRPEDRSLWRKPTSSRRHVGARRHSQRQAGNDTGARTHLEQDRSGEDTLRCEDTRRRENTWARRHLAKTSRANTLTVAKTRGRHRAATAATARRSVFELQGSSPWCSKLYASTCQALFTMAQLHDLIFLKRCLTRHSPRWVPARACARKHRPRPQWRRKRVVTFPAWRRPKWFPNVVLLVHIWRQLPAWRQEAITWRWRQGATKRCVMCPPAWRQGARSRRQMRCQNVASLAHVTSGSQCGFARCGVGSPVASPDVASKRGVTCSRRQGARSRRQMRRQNVASLLLLASKRGVCTRVHTTWASPGVTGRGGRTWRQLLMWRQGAMWRRRTWRQNVRQVPSTYPASQDMASIVNTWRQETQASPARVFKTCLQSSGDMRTPTGDPPVICMHARM